MVKKTLALIVATFLALNLIEESINKILNPGLQLLIVVVLLFIVFKNGGIKLR